MKNLTQGKIIAVVLFVGTIVGTIGYLYGMGDVGEVIADATENTIQGAWGRQDQQSTHSVQVEFRGHTYNVPINKNDTVRDLKEMFQVKFGPSKFIKYKIYDAQGKQLNNNEKLKNASGPLEMQSKIKKSKRRRKKGYIN